MLNVRKHGRGPKLILFLQGIFCTVLLSIGITTVQAGDALWQNPLTGRVITLPYGVSVHWGGANAAGMQFENAEKGIDIYLSEGDADAEYDETEDDVSQSDEPINLKPDAWLNGYPILTSDGNIKKPCEFFIQVGQPIWRVRLSNCEDEAAYQQNRTLFDAILPSMVPLKPDEVFNLIIPWSDEKISLNQIGLNTTGWIASAGNSLLDPYEIDFHSFFFKNSKDVKNFDGSLKILGENVDIIVSNRQVNPENLDEQLTASTLKEDNGRAIIAYKKVNIAGRTILKGQYINEWGCCTLLETHYLIPLKNRIWTVVSSVHEDDKGSYPNAAQRIDIIEQIITTLPDNPPDIVTTYTNPETKKQLKLPKGWAVVQDFPDGSPKDLGVVQLDKVKGAVSISYDCGQEALSAMNYWMRTDDYYKKSRFANQNVIIRDDSGFDLFVKDQNGACNLSINNFDREKDKDILLLAEKLFATGQR